MTNLKGLATIVSELRVERTNLVNQLRHVDAALSVLGKLNGGSNYTKPRRTLPAAARRRIAQAQRARWAKARKQQAQPSAKTKTSNRATVRTMSPAARRKIAAAQRARWANIRGQQMKAA